MNSSPLFADQIMRGAREFKQRTGQYLFNHLPPGAGNALSSTLIDPFHKEMTKEEIIGWIDNHLIFDGQEVIAVFNNNQLMWEKK